MSIINSEPLLLGETLGSLLTSVIDAQAQAARATVDFIEDIGTIDGSSTIDSLHELRHVSFKYKKFDENFNTKEFVLEIPLLSMVDIPLLTVKTATFSFNYQITKTLPSETPKPSSSLVSSSIISESQTLSMYKAKPAGIVGTFKKKSTNATSEEKGGLEVTIEVEKAPLPIGIDRILEILELASTETKVEDDS